MFVCDQEREEEEVRMRWSWMVVGVVLLDRETKALFNKQTKVLEWYFRVNCDP